MIFIYKQIRKVNHPFNTLLYISSSQVEQRVIISINKLPNNFISGKSQTFIELKPSAQSSSQNENCVSTTKNLPKNRNCTFPVVRSFT